VARATKTGVPVIDNASVETTVDQVVELVLAEVERVRSPV
jgi:2-phosphoglycerate kinase